MLSCRHKSGGTKNRNKEIVICIRNSQRYWCALIGFVLGALVCNQRATAQSLPLGTVTGAASTNCVPLQQPTPGETFIYRDFDPTMTNCFTATLNCPNVSGIGLLADPLQFVYAYAPNAKGTTLLGTIVMFSGDGGEMAGNAGFQTYYVPQYELAGYQVVEVAWGPYGTKGLAWEVANSNPNSTTKPSILYAACREATFPALRQDERDLDHRRHVRAR